MNQITLLDLLTVAHTYQSYDSFPSSQPKKPLLGKLKHIHTVLKEKFLILEKLHIDAQLQQCHNNNLMNLYKNYHVNVSQIQFVCTYFFTKI